MNQKTRHGKIARLPLEVREELNERLLDGECGRRLLAWLNGLPDVRMVLGEDFDARPINGPNLTAWRQRGYREWLMEREARRVAERLGREAMLKPVGERGATTERLAHWVTGRYAVAAARVRDAESAEEHWRLLREMCADVTQLRRSELLQKRIDLENRRADLSAASASHRENPLYPTKTNR